MLLNSQYEYVHEYYYTWPSFNNYVGAFIQRAANTVAIMQQKQIAFLIMVHNLL